MIMRNINTDLIDAMKIYLPKGNNLANALMDILYLGKEATYRRLRGEDRKSTRLNSSHIQKSRMPSSA